MLCQYISYSLECTRDWYWRLRCWTSKLALAHIKDEQHFLCHRFLPPIWMLGGLIARHISLLCYIIDWRLSSLALFIVCVWLKTNTWVITFYSLWGLPLSPTSCLYLSLFLSTTLGLSLSLYLSFSLYVCLSFYIFLSLSFSPCLSMFLYLSLSLSFAVCLSISLLPVSFFHNLTFPHPSPLSFLFLHLSLFIFLPCIPVTTFAHTPSSTLSHLPSLCIYES